MTLVSEIITYAFRQSNLVARGVAPVAGEITEALFYLNRIVKSTFGWEAGEALQAFPVGRLNIDQPQGWPWWNDVPNPEWWVPKNARLMFNLENSVEIYLNPLPDNGTRFAAIDVAGNLSTYPVTIHGNGRLIEGATSVTLNTNSLDSEWFYRDDTANWAKYSPLAESDTFPFPEEFDDFFITMLAIRLNPSYGIALDNQSQFALTRSRNQLRARYTQNIPTGSELGIVRLSRMSAERDAWRDWHWGYGDTTPAFNVGWPYY